MQSWAESPRKPQGQGCGPLYHNSKFSENSLKVEIPLTIQLVEEFAREPVTLGDYLLRRRIELGLYQKDVAVRLGVTTSTIWNWEHGWVIRKQFIPRIILFLEHNPWLATTEKSTARGQKIDRYGDRGASTNPTFLLDAQHAIFLPRSSPSDTKVCAVFTKREAVRGFNPFIKNDSGCNWALWTRPR